MLILNAIFNQIDDRNGMNSRMKAKDSYKIPEQEYLDKGEALPKEQATQEKCGI
jgi:hypothetical protein